MEWENFNEENAVWSVINVAINLFSTVIPTHDGPVCACGSTAH